MGLLGLLIVCFAVLGLVAALLGLGALGMWLAGRLSGNRRIVKWLVWSICGAFAIVGLLAATSWLLDLRHRADKRTIDIVYTNFHTGLHDGDFSAAYACMSPDYRRTHSLAQFKEDFDSLGERWLALEPGRYLSVWGRSARLHPGSDHFPMSGPIYEFVKIGDDWYLTGEYDWSLD